MSDYKVKERKLKRGGRVSRVSPSLLLRMLVTQSSSLEATMLLFPKYPMCMEAIILMYYIYISTRKC